MEKLGGAHLLLHKIWGFKVDAAGERTDLVLSTHISTSDRLFQSVDGLVLTEWKIVKKLKELEGKINDAKNQANRYSKGSLAAIELSSYRFLVILSEDFIELPNTEIPEDNIIYRIVNIAYKPSSPSKASKNLQ